MNQKDDREGTPKSVRPMIYMYDALTNRLDSELKVSSVIWIKQSINRAVELAVRMGITAVDLDFWDKENILAHQKMVIKCTLIWSV